MSDFQLTGDAKDRLLKWALSDDRCVPTMTMAGAALGLSPVELRTGYFGHPKGIAEFGRCYGLLQAVPELRQAFPWWWWPVLSSSRSSTRGMSWWACSKATVRRAIAA